MIRFFSAARHIRRAIPVLPLGIGAIELDQHRIVNISAERAVYSIEVHLVSVRRQLHSIRQTGGQVGNELRSRTGVALADVPADHELGVSV